MLKKESTDILGVHLDKITRSRALLFIESFLESGRSGQIVTVNPEFVITAQRDRKFREVLNRSHLSVPDGIGIRAADKFQSLPKSKYLIIRFFQTIFQGLFLIGPAIVLYPNYLNTLPETITGVDLSYLIAKISAQKGYPIFLLGAREGVAKKAAEKLKYLYPKLKIVGYYAGSPDKKRENEIIKIINKARPRILLVAYGAPSQEIWIRRNIKKIDSPVVAMGVGGTFDFISGRVKRAPAWMRKINLEWLYRLIREPRTRIKRIYTATILFSWLVWKNKMGQR